MRVSSNTLPNDLIRQIQRQQSMQLDLQQELTRQQKVTQASDNPLVFKQISELQSQQRSQHAYRANLERATLISDLTESNLDFFKTVATDAFDTSDLIETSINDPVVMETNANLINDLLEQLINALNTRNEDEYLFSGSTTSTKPFEVVRDSNGDISAETTIQYSATDTEEPTLVLGQTYIIEAIGTGANQVDFTAGGAASNTVGTVFEYDGGDIAWIQGSEAALSQVAAAIDEDSEDLLVVGKAYQIANPGGSSQFTDSGAINNAAGTQFIYNGTKPTWDGAELIPLQVADTTLIDDPYSLTTGQLYKIAATSPLGYELPNITELDATSAPTLGAGNSLESGTTFRVEVAGDYSSLSGFVNGDVTSTDLTALNVGDVITTTTSGTLTQVIAGDPDVQLTEAPIQAGKTYRIEAIGNSTDLVGSGSAGLPAVGDVFVATGLQPTTWDGLELKSLELPTYDTAFAAGDTVLAGKTLQLSAFADYSSLTAAVDYQVAPAFVAGDTATNGTTVTISQDTVGTDFSAVGGPDGSGANVVGQSFTLTADYVLPAGVEFAQPETLQKGDVITTLQPITVPAGGEMRELIPTLDGTTLDEGESYVVGNTTKSNFLNAGDPLTVGTNYRVITEGVDYSAVGGPTAANAILGDVFTATSAGPLPAGQISVANIGVVEYPDALVEGQQYIIIEPGATTDFTSSGASNSNTGTVFQYNGTAPTFEGTTILVETDASGAPISNDPIAAADQMVAGSFYQIVDNSGNSDFTQSGATSNDAGTIFTANDSYPNWGSAIVQAIYPATDFTAAGAATNGSGTTFTSNGDAVDFGQGGTVYQYFPERTGKTDFTLSGADNNDIGTSFVYNGTEPEFGGLDTADAGALVGYTRERLAGAYVGSDANREFYVAEDKKLSASNDGQRNRELETLVNAMVQLRDAYRLAGDAEEDDILTRDIALERAKEAANRISDSEERILLAMADMGVKQMSLSIAESQDNSIYNARADQVARGVDIDDAEVITKLTQSLDAYQASLQASARTLQLSIMNYL